MANTSRHWVGRGAYDPEVIERDLRRIKAMNLNAVSVFIHHESLGAQHLLDLLRRCEALGLHVNQSLRPGTPMDFQWRQMKELIEYYKLAQNDTVFAYDLAWEPSHGGYAEQEQAYAGIVEPVGGQTLWQRGGGGEGLGCACAAQGDQFAFHQRAADDATHARRRVAQARRGLPPVPR